MNQQSSGINLKVSTFFQDFLNSFNKQVPHSDTQRFYKREITNMLEKLTHPLQRLNKNEFILSMSINFQAE